MSSVPSSAHRSSANLIYCGFRTTQHTYTVLTYRCACQSNSPARDGRTKLLREVREELPGLEEVLEYFDDGRVLIAAVPWSMIVRENKGSVFTKKRNMASASRAGWVSRKVIRLMHCAESCISKATTEGRVGFIELDDIITHQLSVYRKASDVPRPYHSCLYR